MLFNNTSVLCTSCIWHVQLELDKFKITVLSKLDWMNTPSILHVIQCSLQLSWCIVSTERLSISHCMNFHNNNIIVCQLLHKLYIASLVPRPIPRFSMLPAETSCLSVRNIENLGMHGMGLKTKLSHPYGLYSWVQGRAWDKATPTYVYVYLYMYMHVTVYST